MHWQAGSCRAGGAAVGLWETFGAEFHLHWLTLLPAAVILDFVPVPRQRELARSASILTAAVTAAVFQRMGLGEILYTAAMGYRAADREVGALLNGGGIISMLNVSAIICISSSYSGIFKETALLTRRQGPHPVHKQENHALRRHHGHLGDHLHGGLQPIFGHHADQPALR